MFENLIEGKVFWCLKLGHHSANSSFPASQPTTFTQSLFLARSLKISDLAFRARLTFERLKILVSGCISCGARLPLTKQRYGLLSHSFISTLVVPVNIRPSECPARRPRCLPPLSNLSDKRCENVQ